MKNLIPWDCERVDQTSREDDLMGGFLSGHSTESKRTNEKGGFWLVNQENTYFRVRQC